VSVRVRARVSTRVTVRDRERNHSWCSTFTPRRNHSLCLIFIQLAIIKIIDNNKYVFQ